VIIMKSFTQFVRHGAVKGLLAFVATGALWPAWAAETVTVKVNGMVCAFCAQGIEKRLSALPATQEVFVDLKQKIVAVEARAGQQLDMARVKAEITEAGYDVVSMQASRQSVADIRATMKGKP
jgi:copper chaperone CopZ